MNKYSKRLIKMLLRDPLKLRTMLKLKYTKTNEWRTKDYSIDKVSVKAPIVVAVRMSYACNLRCVMCNQWGENGAFIKEPNKMPKRALSLEDWKVFFDDISKFYPYIYFTGGEPLMNKDIIDLVKYANSKHLITGMSTNSTFLEEKAEDLIKTGLDYIYFSLDAPAPVENGSIRISAQGNDSNAEAAAAIKKFIDLRDKLGIGLPVTQVQTIIVQENQDKLVEMGEFVEKLGVDVWGVQLCVYTTPELNDKTSAVYKKVFDQDQIQWGGFIRNFPGLDFNVIEKQLDEIKKRKWKFKLRLYKPLTEKDFNLEKYFTKPEVHAVDRDHRCMNPWIFAQIQPNGEIAFCGSQPDYTIGSVKEGKFMDLWCNEKATKWRNFIQNKLFPSCKRCFALYQYSHFKD